MVTGRETTTQLCQRCRVFTPLLSIKQRKEVIKSAPHSRTLFLKGLEWPLVTRQAEHRRSDLRLGPSDAFVWVGFYPVFGEHLLDAGTFELDKSQLFPLTLKPARRVETDSAWHMQALGWEVTSFTEFLGFSGKKKQMACKMNMIRNDMF